MITGDLKSKVEAVWTVMWSGGISNPIDVIEQLTFLLFLKRLDELHTAEEKKAARLKRDIEDPVFTTKKDQKARWSVFKHLGPAEMYEAVRDVAFPFMKTMGAKGSSYTRHMENAIFKIPTPALLAKVVDMLDAIPMEDRDTKGDIYEYMLGKIASAGQNGQFRTPRHIIRMMVDLAAPRPTDTICDPACGTAGFLVAAGEHLRAHHPEIFTDAKLRKHFIENAFHGYDFDATMLRIGSMNMMLHGIEEPDIVYRDSLGKDHAEEEERFSVILANPPFKGSLDETNTSPKLLQTVKTKKTELLFVALFLRLLKKGGRAAVIVPDGVLFGSSGAHKAAKIQFPLPPLAEQKRIAAVLDKADDLRGKRRQALATLDTLLQSVFLDMFGDPVTNPKKWPTITLRDLQSAPLCNGVFRKSAEYTGSTHAIVWVKELFDGHVLDTTVSRRFDPTSGELARYSLMRGDILFCRSSLKLDGTGYTNVFDSPEMPALFECHLIRLRPDQSRVEPLFLNYLLRTPSMRGRVVGMARTVTMSTLGQGDIERITLPLPPIEAQREFAAVLRQVMNVQERHREASPAFDTLFASLQSAAFAGTLFNGEMVKAAASKPARSTTSAAV